MRSKSPSSDTEYHKKLLKIQKTKNNWFDIQYIFRLDTETYLMQIVAGNLLPTSVKTEPTNIILASYGAAKPIECTRLPAIVKGQKANLLLLITLENATSD